MFHLKQWDIFATQTIYETKANLNGVIIVHLFF